MFGQLLDGQEVFKYTLTNQNGVSASFLDLGGIWHSMIVPGRDGQMADVVLGFDTIPELLNNSCHLGEIVGRNANRIGGAKFSINGTTYQLAANDGANNLHSGPDFYRNRLWEAEVKETEKGTCLLFKLNSPDGDQGYPGNAEITVSYTLTDQDELCIDYYMTSDQDTIANLTNHSYFNMAGHQSGIAAGQQVWIDADFMTAADAHSIPTGELLPVKGTPMDFTEFKPIGKEIDEDFDQLRYGSGYDHNWALNHQPGMLFLSAKAWDEASGRLMEVYTDLPGIQFYTGNYLEAGMSGKEGAVYGPRHGYCFETQYAPDAVNQPKFQSPILKAGEEYRTTTIYKFMVK